MKNIKRYKQLFIILGPIILLVIVLSISYAYWRKSSTQTNLNKIDILNCLSSTLTDETSAISLTDEFPITNEEGMQKEPYTFKITNNCDQYVYADITLEVLGTSTLGATYIRGSLNNVGNTADNSINLTSLPSATPTIGVSSHIFKKDALIEPNSSSSYDLRIWIDYDTTIEQGFDKTVESKIVIIYSPAPMPIHLAVEVPNNPMGIYSTTFEGATWNHKTASLDISSLSGELNDINLINVNTESAVNLASYIISLAGTDQGNGKLINENGYRYEGKNPNNWIMFNGEYWRIIGVFDQNTHGKTGQNLVKIIREDSIGGLVWDKSDSNDWNASSLKALLNNNYYNGINEDTITNCYGVATTNAIPGNCNFKKDGITKEAYRNMIENITWKLGGRSNTSTAGTLYTAERGTTVYSGRPTSGTGYIGLMYPSDYGYSVLASDCARTTNLNAYDNVNCGGKSWLSGYGMAEYTLMPYSGNGYTTFYIIFAGGVDFFDARSGLSVRPVLYLKSEVLKLSGNGSFENSYIIVK